MTLQTTEVPADALAFEHSLERLDPQWQALHQRLHRPRQPWQGQLGGAPLSVAWASSGAAMDEPQLELWLSLGDSPVQLHVPARALDLLGLPEGLLLPSLPAALLLEQALLTLIAPLEHLFSQPIHVLDRALTQCVELAPLSLGLEVRLGDSALAVQLRCDAATWAEIAVLLEQHAAPMPHDLGGLALTLGVDGGEAWLSLVELRSLLPGDVVMLDPWPDDHLRLHLDDQWQARVQRDGKRLQLIEPPITALALKERHMSEQGTGPSLDSSLDELQLKLVCQVGSVELSLAQLRELGVGSVLELAPRMHEGVDLMINGRRVGQGQLVKIGDGLGVRLLSFAAS
ncbi:YscQ/HrcQ family type III secretion apparatus protein [Pseudomonas putida]|uniref:FliM/FliN family flagellar motor switch protein n=1 Tax=Pseudomonas putida TaxID=303 RepID=UPI000F76EC37|nr:FliM/FliN family flagellar motor switch protein [Pseudomonas putida]RSC26952.1 YscQ/HrcQ family type III secretion apparatus protein [Pseudomonas putida]